MSLSAVQPGPHMLLLLLLLLLADIPCRHLVTDLTFH
jgi:hypothetical protein